MGADADPPVSGAAPDLGLLSRILQLPATSQRVAATAAELGRTLPFAAEAELRVVVLGPSQPERHRLVRAIVGSGLDQVGALDPRYGAVAIPVEFVPANGARLVR